MPTRSLPRWALAGLALTSFLGIVGGLDGLTILRYQLYLSAAQVPLALAVLVFWYGRIRPRQRLLQSSSLRHP